MLIFVDNAKPKKKNDEYVFVSSTLPYNRYMPLTFLIFCFSSAPRLPHFPNGKIHDSYKLNTELM
jgi:hypothetical protein